ncbi:MAG: hypothetical protein ACKOOC_08380, partial [Cyanobium sp.]
MQTHLEQGPAMVRGVALGIDGAQLPQKPQRRGRAGRLGPGCCVRLWSSAEQGRRPPFTTPEILDIDP